MYSDVAAGLAQFSCREKKRNHAGSLPVDAIHCLFALLLSLLFAVVSGISLYMARTRQGLRNVLSS